jgi:Protein of unknown function (DUF5818)
MKAEYNHLSRGEDMSENLNDGSAICVKGRLTEEGIECPALRTDEGNLFTLIGDLGDFHSGDDVFVCGTVSAQSICMQGTTINLFWIGDVLGETLENSLKQEIKMTWPQQFIASKWKKRPFSKYTNDSDDPKVAVLYPTRRVATAVGIELNQEIEHALQSKVG